MGLKSRIISLALKAARTFRLTSSNLNYFLGDGEYAYNDASYQEFAQNGFGKNPYIYAVVDKISDVSASLPRHLTDQDGGEPSMSTDSLSFGAILSNPNYRDSQNEFYYKIFSNLLITGNAIVYSSEPVGMSQPGELWVANTSDVDINTDNGQEWGKPVSYSILNRGTIAAEDVLHIRYPNPIEDTNWGLSPLNAGQYVYTASNDTFEAKAHILKNRGVSGVLSAKDSSMPMNPADQEQLQKNWDNRTAGAKKFGKLHITSAALDYLDIGMSSKDLELIKHNVENLRDVCRIYGVDSSLFGDPANRTYSNQEQAVQAFYRDVVLPLSELVDQNLNDWLLHGKYELNDLYWVVNTEEIQILNKPQIELSEKVISEVTAGILTTEEAKEILYPEL